MPRLLATLKRSPQPSAPSHRPGRRRKNSTRCGLAGNPHQRGCADVAVDRVGLLRGRVDGVVAVGSVPRRRPWRRAVAVACSVLLVAVITAAGMVVMLFALYARTPAPEPVSWS